jgi:hypothetical protein
MLIVGPPARDEFRSLCSHVVPRSTSIELARRPTTMQTSFVGGPTSLPIRYELTS